MSLDGFIAGPGGEYDWIPHDPDVDFAAMFAEYDTFLLGRKTFEPIGETERGLFGDKRVYVFSRTLRQEDYPWVTMVRDRPELVVAEIKEQPGKDIWLFGGGVLFRSLAQAGLVDAVETAVVPVLLGQGIPLMPTASRISLAYTGQRVYPKTGMVLLKYNIRK